MFSAGLSERKQSSVARTVGAVVAVAWCLLALPAQAGEGDKAVARAHYETATRLYEVREYADALKAYKAAYVAKPDAAFLFNIGQCYRKLDKNAEALDFFQQFLKKSPPDDPNRALVEARIRNIEAGLNSDYDPFDKSGATKAPEPAVKAAPSFAPFPVSPPEPVQPLAAQPALPAEPTPPQPSVAPQAEAHPAAMATQPIRRQRAEVAAARPMTRDNSAAGAADANGWWLGRKWTWVAAGSAAVFASGAVIAGAAMQSKFDNLNSSCGTTSVRQQGCNQSDVDALDTRKNAANLMWGLAGAAVVTAGVLFYLEGRPVTITPMAGETTGLLASVRY